MKITKPPDGSTCTVFIFSIFFSMKQNDLTGKKLRLQHSNVSIKLLISKHRSYRCNHGACGLVSYRCLWHPSVVTRHIPGRYLWRSTQPLWKGCSSTLLPHKAVLPEHKHTVSLSLSAVTHTHTPFKARLSSLATTYQHRNMQRQQQRPDHPQ